MTGTAAGLGTLLRGPVIDPPSESHDADRRVWNGATAIRFARQHGLPVAVRSGGHGAAGRATGQRPLAARS